jgi:LacI family transcriptional regulator
MPHSSPEQPPKRVSLRDIANKCGVSASTVSAVLHDRRGNNSRFSPQTRQLVLETAEAMGYRANRFFRNFSRRRHGVLGIVHAPDGFVPHPTLTAMSMAAAARDYMLVFSHVEQSEPMFLKEDAVDGLVILGDAREDLGRRAEKLEIPTLYVNCNRRLVPGTITYDEEGGIRQVMTHLAERGRKQVLFLQPAVHREKGPAHYSEIVRWETIQQCSREFGMKGALNYRMTTWFETDVRRQTDTYEPAIEELMTLLRNHPACDAVVLDYRLVGIALKQAMNRLGRRVPEDLAIIAMNTFNTVDIGYPPHTSLGLDFEGLGKVIIDTLSQAVDQAKKPAPVIYPLQLYIREST